MKKILFFVSLIGSLLGLLPTAHAAQNFVFCMEGSPSSFNPQLVTDGVSMNASAQAIFNRLVEFKRGKTEIEPGLAESWTISKNKKTYTFKLRKNVSFHSNSIFTPTRMFNADDVVYTFNTQMDTKHPLSIPAASYDYFKSMELDQLIASVKKTDDYTVVIELKHPEAPFLADLAMDFASILSEEYANSLVKSGKGLKMLETQPIGTGPFVFKSYQKDSTIRYTAFDKYFKGKPKIENLIFVIVTDSTVRLQKMKSGECSVMNEPQPQDLDQIKAMKNVKLVSTEGINVSYIAFNTQKKPFDNLKVREALSMAMNQKSYLDIIYKSQGTAARNPIPPTMWSYSKNTTLNTFDVAKAKKLLADAGYPNGFDTELWTLPVSRPYLPNGKKLGELVQADLAKIGVKVKLVTFDWPVYLEKSKKGEHQMIQFGWTGDNGDPDNFMNVLLGCGAVQAGSNYARWCNQEFDTLLQKAKIDSAQSARTGYYEKAQVIFNREKPWYPIAHAKLNKVISDKVVGYQIDPFGHEQFESVDLK
ncbi:MAG: ABC transporter substrate-binding protein [Bdellovibrionaceae bacterium]|nr:ABC transporter substrate-binding protein [Bdellovibrio sp.]